MHARRRYTLSVVLAFVLAAGLAAQCGCQPSGATTGATTQPSGTPSLATLTTQAEAALDAAVNSVTIGRQLGVIDDATFGGFIVPSVMAVRDATRQMEAAASKGDQPSWLTASEAAGAAMARLRPILDKVQAAQVKGAK